jgi:hypothetical protein
MEQRPRSLTKSDLESLDKDESSRGSVQARRGSDAWSTKARPSVIPPPPLQLMGYATSFSTASARPSSVVPGATTNEPRAPSMVSPDGSGHGIMDEDKGHTKSGPGQGHIRICEICNCHVSGGDNWIIHLLSKGHRRREILTSPALAGAALDPTILALLENPRGA